MPTTAEGLPPLGEAFTRTLADGLADLGLHLDQVVLDAIHDHARLLVAWNRAINLTAIRDAEAIARLHVIDSLSALAAMATPPSAGARPARRPALLDMGSGGGYPGLPLAVALPAGRVALVESVARKARFLEAAAAVMTARLHGAGQDAPAIEVFAERAEELARDKEEREGWDFVTARAVGSLAEVIELALPLLRPGGRVVAWKREGPAGQLSSELRVAGEVNRAAGGGRPEVLTVATPLLPAHRLVVVPKVRPSPMRFPRPPVERRRRGRQAPAG